MRKHSFDIHLSVKALPIKHVQRQGHRGVQQSRKAIVPRYARKFASLPISIESHMLHHTKSLVSPCFRAAMTAKATLRASKSQTNYWRTMRSTQVSSESWKLECWRRFYFRLTYSSLVLETRAFRALSMSGLGKMKEAVKEIKAVLMKNMMNYTCWHIMGIIHRKEK